MGMNVIDEELPFRSRPGAPVSVAQTFEAVEASEIAGDEIEFFFGRGQVEVRPNAVHHAFHLKQPQGVAKNCLFVDVQSNAGVAEFSPDIKKETGTAAEIEKVKAPSTIE